MTLLLPPPVRPAFPAAGPRRSTPVAPPLLPSVLPPAGTGAAAQHDVARTARVAVRFILASIAVLLLLQALALPTQDPLRGTISGMVHAPAGILLFAAMGTLCVTGSAMLATSLARLGARKAAVAVWIWCGALAVAAVVPTDPPGALGVSLAAEIHRDSAGVMFTALPVAALLVAAHRSHRSAALRHAQRALRRSATVAALAGALQLPMSIPSLFPGTAIASWPAVEALYSVRGLAERALFVALLLVLIRTATAVTLAGAAQLRDAARSDVPRAAAPAPSRSELRGSIATGRPVSATSSRVRVAATPRSARRAAAP